MVPGAETLQFRDIYAVSDKVAYLLSIGNNPTDFRISKTLNGGATWHIEFINQDPNAFYDCFAFWNPRRGLAHSDSVSGVFPELRTTNGINWLSIANLMPPALPGEASFAASGTCITTQGGENAWIATGGGKYCAHFGHSRQWRYLERIRHSVGEFTECRRDFGGVPESVEWNSRRRRPGLKR